MDFEIQIYLIISNAYGKLDLLLRDTITAIQEIGYGTTNLNYYRYEEVNENTERT